MNKSAMERTRWYYNQLKKKLSLLEKIAFNMDKLYVFFLY
jgi:hypothetical protein